MYHSSGRAEMRSAILFASCLAISMLFFTAIALSSAGPVILGTEMNANGMVEYLCLGSGCESFTQMDW